MKRCDRSNKPFRLRITRLEDHPADLELATERGKRLGRAPTGSDRRLAVPNQLLRQRAEPTEVARQAPEDVRRFLAEHQRAGDHTRPAHLAGHDPAATSLTVTDRHLLARLPQIALDQLPGPIHSPLKRPRHQEPRADLAHEVVEDRLPTLIADLRRQLPQPLRLDPRLRLKLLADPVPERIKLRPGRPAPVPRRLTRRQHPRDRLACQPRPATDLPRRHPVNPVHPPHHRPLLHADQSFLLADRNRSSEGQRPAGQHRPSAEVAYFSTGADGTVFNRRPHLGAAVCRAESRAAMWVVFPPAAMRSGLVHSPQMEADFSPPRQLALPVGCWWLRSGGRWRVAVACATLVMLACWGLSLASTARADTSLGQSIVNEAANWSGTQYCWDGGNQNGPTRGIADPTDGGYTCASGTTGFDCTGLTLYAVYQATGGQVLLSHDPEQATSDPSVSRQTITNPADLEPGDIVYFGGTLDDNVHAGVYAGVINGKPSFWSAVTEGIGVALETMAWEEAANAFVGAIRFSDDRATSLSDAGELVVGWWF